ncbi:unnamed protein product [Rotaria socialis]|uniref:SAM-dependent MTase RsmB/NOP-type domain-containing protein n=1 Tax=Rotaria socialis TaxID=392032 RepID=A0A820BT55_9BILA|nr:unnamed protein product [Rotaria socialis]
MCEEQVAGFHKSVKRLSNLKYFIDPEVEHVLVFATGTKFFDYDIYLNRHILLMDKASCLPCLALSPPPGSTVLDACAAPGNKTICLANYLKNKGVLYAIELNRRRFKELNANLKSAGVKCAHTLNDDFLTVALPFDEIDYVLLDPSCSGSGIRNRADDTKVIDEERLERLSALQTRMITHVMTKFSKVKRVTYSTCSIYSQENEQVVETILDQFSDTFQLVDFLPEWPSRGQTERTRACLRASPDDTLTNGFFVACFERIIKIDIQ